MAIASEFEEIQEAFARSGATGALDYLIGELRRQERFHELYEALKMRARVQLGLPIAPSGEEIPEEKREPLETALVAACREVGGLLLRSGRIRDGWIYYRPVGDRAEVAKLIDEISPTHDNIDEIVQVLLGESVAPERGFDLALEFFGTCQSITLFEQEIVRHPKPVQQHAAARLIAKVHSDLITSVHTDIQRQVAEIAQSPTIAGLIADRDWLFENNAYHIDTTHLAAVVRYGKVVDDRTTLELALDLTEYGRKLSPQFQYASEEPFGALYPDHATFFRALLGQNVEEGLAFFRQKATTLDPQEYGPGPVEVYVDLLSRVGRPREALEAAVELFPKGMQAVGIAPTLLELARACGAYEPMLEFCRSRGDLLGYAAGLLDSPAASTR